MDIAVPKNDGIRGPESHYGYSIWFLIRFMFGSRILSINCSRVSVCMRVVFVVKRSIGGVKMLAVADEPAIRS